MADGLARSGFDKDLAFGEARESAFVEAIRNARVECKSDQKCRRTGNVAIEIRQGSPEKGAGRKSGIYATEAKWWCVEFADDRWIVIRTSVLRGIVDHVLQLSGTVMVGDGNRFENVLVPIGHLIQRLEVVKKKDDFD